MKYSKLCVYSSQIKNFKIICSKPLSSVNYLNTEVASPFNKEIQFQHMELWNYTSSYLTFCEKNLKCSLT